MIPDIPKLVSLMDMSISYVDVMGLDWNPVVPFDMTRYYLEFMVIAGGNCQIGIDADSLGVKGYDLPFQSPLAFEFNKHPLLVNQQWLAFDKGLATTLQITQIFMRKTETQAARMAA